MRKSKGRQLVRPLLVAAGVLLLAAALYVAFSPPPRRATVTAQAQKAYAEAVRLLKGRVSVADRLREFGEPARARLRAHFQKAGVPYPPKEATLAAFKQEKTLQVYAADANGKMRQVYSYPVLAASGKLGPKLRYGDYQVPEGVYHVTYLNPNSRYHVALRLNYPNEFDRAMAKRNGRTNLGGDIMIHGYDRSIGCLAMGDAVSEDLFTLAADVGQENLRVLLCPTDLRTAAPPLDPARPAWTQALYADLRRELLALGNQHP